jgi:hypothetical protein
MSTSKSKVVIMGDSHLQGSVLRIDNYLSSKFKVSEFIKPGAGFEKIVEMSILDHPDLTNKDVLIRYVMVVLMMSTTVTQKK